MAGRHMGFPAFLNGKKGRMDMARNNGARTAVNTSQAENNDRNSGTYRVKQLPQNMIVTVRNGFHGLLVYRSERTGERFVWDSFGDEQDMELRVLKDARNSSKAFFENNWFLISDAEVIAALGLERYYKDALSYEEFDELFKMSPEDIAERLRAIPDGQKTSIAYRAKQLIAEGAIDSIKAITALEEGLGVELIER